MKGHFSMHVRLHFDWARLLVGLSWQRQTSVRQDGPTRPLIEAVLWRLELGLGPLVLCLETTPRELARVQSPAPFPYHRR